MKYWLTVAGSVLVLAVSGILLLLYGIKTTYVMNANGTYSPHYTIITSGFIGGVLIAFGLGVLTCGALIWNALQSDKKQSRE